MMQYLSLSLPEQEKRAFCTGADLREQEAHIARKPDDYYKWMYAFIEMHDRLRNIGKPTVARLNGMAWAVETS